ncbi:dehydrogenase [Streptomyces sp. AHA2]|uniref:dehydrogenase n=1 Tax=Streptomyces sp. AHA2 TaxID=3064526 RepID=UPI002FE08C32
MTDFAPDCPECSQPMKAGGFALSAREDDGRRACRLLWGCAGRHIWWRWADRLDGSLEACPVPKLFR